MIYSDNNGISVFDRAGDSLMNIGKLSGDGYITRSMGNRELIINGKEMNLKAETWLIIGRHKSVKGKFDGFLYLLRDFHILN